jgi:sialate O-acetylesterase
LPQVFITPFFTNLPLPVTVYPLWEAVTVQLPLSSNVNKRFDTILVPFLSLIIKGIIWYQGESNTGNPERYDALMPTLITNWRTLWKEEKLPFLVVQLVNFQDINYTPTESNWARLREAQNQALKLPNTAVTVTIDLGEWNDIHPLNKKDIGKRLALAAENIAYNEKKVIHSGPTFKSQTIENGKITLTFDDIAEGITSKDGEELRWFSCVSFTLEHKIPYP